MQNSIDISNYVNVSTTITPAGIPQFNPNIVGFFTTNRFINGNQNDVYREYLNATAVANDFGTNTSTYKLANILFSQSPNIKAGGGVLRIIPMLDSVNASPAKFTTANISANLTNIITVSNGDLKITADGQVFNLTNLNFTKCNNWLQVADVLLNYVAGYVNIDVLYISNVASGLIFSSKKVGISSAVTVEQLAGSGIDLSGATYFDITNGVETTGTVSTGETLLQAKTRISNAVNYMPFFTDLLMEDSYILEVASDTQSKKQMFMHEVSSIIDIGENGIAKQIVSNKYTKTRMLGHLKDILTAQNFKVAYTGRAFCVDFMGINTTLTMNLKQLSSVPADTIITDSLLAQFKTVGVDTYPNTAGVGYINAQGNANDYFDNQYNAIWLDSALQVELFNILAKTNTKIIQTQEGMSVLRNGIIAICKQGMLNGMGGTGLIWTGDTFGNRQDFIDNIYSQGCYIYQLPISQQSATDRANRISPLFQVAYKLGGAVHSVSVQITLEQ